jgi:tetrahydromethanopterin S-methyltransferase subunit H
MFTVSGEQKVCQIGDIKIGGKPGDNPPLMIASMFHNGDRILESRKERKFDREKAKEYVLTMKELSQSTGIPGIVAMVANSADEMKTYIDFITSISDQPFGIDMWVQKARVEAMKYVAELGLQDRVLYNSITPWDKDIPEQIEQLKEMGVKHVVLQVFDEGDQTPAGRLKSFEKLMEVIGHDTFETVLVDTSVMNLPAVSFSNLANKLIKEKYGWPAGVACSNGTYMWKEARGIWGKEGFQAIDSAGQAASVMFWSDFNFFGPIVGAKRIFPATVSATLMLATFIYHETGKLPENKNHPIYKYFADFADKIAGTA